MFAVIASHADDLRGIHGREQMCLLERNRLHLFFPEDTGMIFLWRRNAAHDYVLAALGLYFPVLRAIGGRKLAVTHVYRLLRNWDSPNGSPHCMSLQGLHRRRGRGHTPSAEPALRLLQSACSRCHARRLPKWNKNIWCPAGLACRCRRQPETVAGSAWLCSGG